MKISSRLETASQIARNYCLIKNGAFLLPTRENILERRVIITTLSTSKVLLNLQVFHGFFTHILIDEAAQALEPETLTPLVFAGPETKVVFTGDHMQVRDWHSDIIAASTKVKFYKRLGNESLRAPLL